MANPAMDRRITAEFIRRERAALPPEEFARERLGWWDAPLTDQARRITTEQWMATESGAVIDAPTFGIAVSFDRAWSAIGVAGMVGDACHVELADYRRGTRWIPGRVAELRERHPDAVIGLVPGTAAASLITELPEDIQLLTAAEWSQACAQFVDAACADVPQISHAADPVLAGAVANATTRDRGDGGFVWWASDSAGDISPLIAATIARFLVPTEPAYSLMDSIV
jgi:hypothetical protein